MKFNNSLLQALEEDVLSRLRLRPVSLELNHEIEYPGSPVKNLYFLETGMASMTTTFRDGSQVEVGTFGYESVIGTAALMGTKKALNRVYTQIAGHGFHCSIESARKEFLRGGNFQSLVLRYVQAQLVQAVQSIGCNAKHNFEQRLARWLLICGDRSHSDTFNISHRLLADMLGGTRATVSIAAGVLRDKGVIRYSRGVMSIVDFERLEKSACECYLIIKRHLGDYAQFDTQIAE